MEIIYFRRYILILILIIVTLFLNKCEACTLSWVKVDVIFTIYGRSYLLNVIIQVLYENWYNC